MALTDRGRVSLAKSSQVGRVSITLNHSPVRVMRGQKRVDKGVHARLRRAMDARERAYHPRIHLLRKGFLKLDGLPGRAWSSPAMTGLWFGINASRLSGDAQVQDRKHRPGERVCLRPDQTV